MGQYTTEFTENLMRQHNEAIAELHQLEERVAKQGETVNALLRLLGRQSEARQAAERERVELAEFVLDRWPFNAGRSVTGSLRLQKAIDAHRMSLPSIFNDEGALVTQVGVYRNHA
jgi:predicted O-linked N-acetylglucosamine transferase (SPINDLY family)